MHILEHLGLALGLSTLAGLDLYLTVLITGVAVRSHFIHLGADYHDLEALGHPGVIAVAGVMYSIEFFADKIPWVDSLWDSVHTFIRPVGGALLGMQALGDMPPHLQVIAGLIAGSAALTTHSAKAGTRLLINHSPEPVSNVVTSVTEDAVVGGGTMLVFSHPVVALAIFTFSLVVLWILIPRLFRLLAQSFHFLQSQFRSLFGHGAKA